MKIEDIMAKVEESKSEGHTKVASMIFDNLPGADLMSKINDDAQKEKTAAFIGKSFEQMLWEEGIARKILDFKDIEDSEKIFDPTNNTEYAIFPISQSTGQAIESNFVDVPTAREVSQKWARVGYGRMQLPKTIFDEMEMKTTKSRPLLDAKEKSLYNFMETEDRQMVAAMNYAAKLTGKHIVMQTAYFDKSAFVALKNLIDGDRQQAATIVSAKTVLNDLYLWDRNEIGATVADTRWSEGKNMIETNAFGSLEWIPSLKEELFVRSYFKVKAGSKNGDGTDKTETLDLYDPDILLTQDGKATVVRRERDIYMLTQKDTRGHGRIWKPMDVYMKKENGKIELGGDTCLGFTLYSRGVAKLTLPF